MFATRILSWKYLARLWLSGRTLRKEGNKRSRSTGDELERFETIDVNTVQWLEFIFEILLLLSLARGSINRCARNAQKLLAEIDWTRNASSNQEIWCTRQKSSWRSRIKRAANIRNETLTTRGEARLPTRRRRLANRLPQLTLEPIREARLNVN